jgi:predicted lipid-binding transport protein (Tim44 family)
MKSIIIALTVAVFCAGLTPSTADAKRIGGAKSSGVQRSLPPPAAAPAPKPTQATPAAPVAAAAPAAVPPKRSWMGPLAGLAAGLGIAALMSSMGLGGLGGGIGNIIMLVLMAVLGFVAIRFLMKRFAGNGASGNTMGSPGHTAGTNGLQFAGAAPTGAGAGLGGSPSWGQAAPAATSLASVSPVAIPFAGNSAPILPTGFDAAGFEHAAKLIFIRMQAANDRSDLNDLRNFTTPEMFATIKLDLQERGNTAQTTDVVKVDAAVLDVSTEADRQLVSVRFYGLIREEASAAPEAFDEVWHLAKSNLAGQGTSEWAIAGIQQQSV